MTIRHYHITTQQWDNGYAYGSKDIGQIYKVSLGTSSWDSGDGDKGGAEDVNEDEDEFSRGSWYNKLEDSYKTFTREQYLGERSSLFILILCLPLCALSTGSWVPLTHFHSSNSSTSETCRSNIYPSPPLPHSHTQSHPLDPAEVPWTHFIFSVPSRTRLLGLPLASALTTLLYCNLNNSCHGAVSDDSDWKRKVGVRQKSGEQETDTEVEIRNLYGNQKNGNRTAENGTYCMLVWYYLSNFDGLRIEYTLLHNQYFLKIMPVFRSALRNNVPFGRCRTLVWSFGPQLSRALKTAFHSKTSSLYHLNIYNISFELTSVNPGHTAV